MPLADAVTRQSAVVPVVGIGVIKTLSRSSCFRVGMDIPQGIQHSSVVLRRNGSGVIPGFPKVPAATS